MIGQKTCQWEQETRIFVEVISLFMRIIQRSVIYIFITYLHCIEMTIAKSPERLIRLDRSFSVTDANV